MLEGTPLVVLHGVPGCPDDPPPRDVAAVPGHHGSDRTGCPGSDRGRDIAVRHRHALGDAGHDIQNRFGELGIRLARCARHVGARHGYRASAPSFSPYGVSPMTLKPTASKNFSGPPSPLAHTTVACVKPRARASSANAFTANRPTPLP